MPAFDSETMHKVLFFVGVCLIAFILQMIVTRAARHALEKGHVPKGSILVNLIIALIWFFALLAVLEPVFGVEPTAFIAALGVVSIAVSFGLQNTISNIVSGIGLMLAHVIQVGDWIEVGDYRGVVTDITWRATTIRTLIGDTVVIPNSVLNTTTLRKMGPIGARTVTITFDIFPDADMVEVERDIRESVEKAVEPWRDPELPIDLLDFGYGNLGFRVDVRVPLRTMDDALAARSAIVASVSGRTWLAHW